MRFFDTQYNFLHATTCAGCQKKKSVILCQQCINRIERARFSCVQCAKPMASETAHQRCADCLQKPPRFDETRTVGKYDNILKSLILSAKLKREVQAIQALRYLFCLHVDLSRIDLNTTCLVAVPSPKTRMATRGFNLPQLLAVSLHREFGLPIVKHAFYTPFHVRKQTRKARQTRLDKHAVFTPTRDLANQIAVTPQVLLIDDVLTTGATADSIARRLKDVKAGKVIVQVLAR